MSQPPWASDYLAELSYSHHKYFALFCIPELTYQLGQVAYALSYPTILSNKENAACRLPALLSL